MAGAKPIWPSATGGGRSARHRLAPSRDWPGRAPEKHAALRKQVKVDKIDPLARSAPPKTGKRQREADFGEVADRYVAVHELYGATPSICVNGA